MLSNGTFRIAQTSWQSWNGILSDGRVPANQLRQPVAPFNVDAAMPYNRVLEFNCKGQLLVKFIGIRLFAEVPNLIRFTGIVEDLFAEALVRARLAFCCCLASGMPSGRGMGSSPSVLPRPAQQNDSQPISSTQFRANYVPWSPLLQWLTYEQDARDIFSHLIIDDDNSTLNGFLVELEAIVTVRTLFCRLLCHSCKARHFEQLC